MSIKQQINKLGTRENASRKLGVSLRTIYRWMNGESKPSPLASEKIKQLIFINQMNGNHDE